MIIVGPEWEEASVWCESNACLADKLGPGGLSAWADAASAASRSGWRLKHAGNHASNSPCRPSSPWTTKTKQTHPSPELLLQYSSSSRDFNLTSLHRLV